MAPSKRGTQVKRVLSLLYILAKAGRQISLSELSLTLDVSIKTVHRDIRTLQDLGFSVHKAKRGQTSYFYLASATAAWLKLYLRPMDKPKRQ